MGVHMPKHVFTPIKGRIERWVLDSKLRSNRLGDPTEREILTHITPEGLDMIEQGGKFAGADLFSTFYFIRSCSSRMESICRNFTSKARTFGEI